MNLERATIAAVVWFGLGIGVAANSSGRAHEDEIATFNKKYREMHLNMDTQGIFETWAEDGVDLMPGEAPIIGKKAIVAWVEAILAKLPGHRVTTQDMEFHDIHVSGDWASEWAFEHQIVRAPDDRPSFDGHGKLLLVLHREKDGNWRIKREMWNQGIKP